MANLDLFTNPIDFDPDKRSGPLADRMRPTDLTHFVGQEHLLSEGKVLRTMIEQKQLQSLIFWGPPGSGKTTLAHIIAASTEHNFTPFSAVFSSMKEVRAVMEQAHTQRHVYGRKTILFIDEIHRFNKAQQDGFLPFVEKGDIILIGATTENPSFEVNPALLSRAKVLIMQPLQEADLVQILQFAIDDPKNGLGEPKPVIAAEDLRLLARIANGDARTALTTLEIAHNLATSAETTPVTITADIIQEAFQQKLLRYDKSGEEHYNLISALHKSLRGSDPDAALYWLARMLMAGEDPLYVARRMVRFASEDVGNADPQALQVALAARDAYHYLGSPEGELALVQAVVYLATAPKSNALYEAYSKVKKLIKKTGNLDVPLHIRNAPTRLMKDVGYGKGYQYDHDSEDHYIPQAYLPTEIADQTFYKPSKFGFEKEIQKRLDWWARKKQETQDSEASSLSEQK